MAKTQYYTATSIDGFIADQNQSLDWLFAVQRDDPDEFASFFANVGAMCMGATTYEWALGHDQLLDHPELWQSYYGETPCWVFTHRDLPAVPGANLTFVSGDVVPVHDAMVEAAGDRNVWLVGGGELVGRFADAGRLDQIRLGVAPVFLGGGAPLLPRRLLTDRVSLTHVERNGQLAVLTYQLTST